MDAAPCELDGMPPVSAGHVEDAHPALDLQLRREKVGLALSLLRGDGPAPHIERKPFKKTLKPVWIHFVSPGTHENTYSGRVVGRESGELADGCQRQVLG